MNLAQINKLTRTSFDVAAWGTPMKKLKKIKSKWKGGSGMGELFAHTHSYICKCTYTYACMPFNLIRLVVLYVSVTCLVLIV